MNRGLIILNTIIPKIYSDELYPKKLSQSQVFDLMYKNNLVNPILEFVQRLKMNWIKKSEGLSMCIPYVKWNTYDTVPTLYCIDNINIIRNLNFSIFGYIYSICSNYVYMIKKANAKVVYHGDDLYLWSNTMNICCGKRHGAIIPDTPPDTPDFQAAVTLNLLYLEIDNDKDTLDDIIDQYTISIPVKDGEILDEETAPLTNYSYIESPMIFNLSETYRVLIEEISNIYIASENTSKITQAEVYLVTYDIHTKKYIEVTDTRTDMKKTTKNLDIVWGLDSASHNSLITQLKEALRVQSLTFLAVDIYDGARIGRHIIELFPSGTYSESDKNIIRLVSRIGHTSVTVKSISMPSESTVSVILDVGDIENYSILQINDMLHLNLDLNWQSNITSNKSISVKRRILDFNPGIISDELTFNLRKGQWDNNILNEFLGYAINTYYNYTNPVNTDPQIPQDPITFKSVNGTYTLSDYANLFAPTMIDSSSESSEPLNIAISYLPNVSFIKNMQLTQPVDTGNPYKLENVISNSIKKNSEWVFTNAFNPIDELITKEFIDGIPNMEQDWYIKWESLLGPSDSYRDNFNLEVKLYNINNTTGTVTQETNIPYNPINPTPNTIHLTYGDLQNPPSYSVRNTPVGENPYLSILVCLYLIMFPYDTDLTSLNTLWPKTFEDGLSWKVPNISDTKYHAIPVGDDLNYALSFNFINPDNINSSNTLQYVFSRNPRISINNISSNQQIYKIYKIYRSFNYIHALTYTSNDFTPIANIDINLLFSRINYSTLNSTSSSGINNKYQINIWYLDDSSPIFKINVSDSIHPVIETSPNVSNLSDEDYKNYEETDPPTDSDLQYQYQVLLGTEQNTIPHNQIETFIPLITQWSINKEHPNGKRVYNYPNKIYGHDLEELPHTFPVDDKPVIAQIEKSSVSILRSISDIDPTLYTVGAHIQYENIPIIPYYNIDFISIPTTSVGYHYLGHPLIIPGSPPGSPLNLPFRSSIVIQEDENYDVLSYLNNNDPMRNIPYTNILHISNYPTNMTQPSSFLSQQLRTSNYPFRDVALSDILTDNLDGDMFIGFRSNRRKYTSDSWAIIKLNVNSTGINLLQLFSLASNSNNVLIPHHRYYNHIDNAYGQYVPDAHRTNYIKGIAFFQALFAIRENGTAVMPADMFINVRYGQFSNMYVVSNNACVLGSNNLVLGSVEYIWSDLYIHTDGRLCRNCFGNVRIYYGNGYWGTDVMIRRISADPTWHDNTKTDPKFLPEAYWDYPLNANPDEPTLQENTLYSLAIDYSHWWKETIGKLSIFFRNYHNHNFVEPPSRTSFGDLNPYMTPTYVRKSIYYQRYYNQSTGQNETANDYAIDIHITTDGDFQIKSSIDNPININLFLFWESDNNREYMALILENTGNNNSWICNVFSNTAPFDDCYRNVLWAVRPAWWDRLLYLRDNDSGGVHYDLAFTGLQGISDIGKGFFSILEGAEWLMPIGELGPRRPNQVTGEGWDNINTFYLYPTADPDWNRVSYPNYFPKGPGEYNLINKPPAPVSDVELFIGTGVDDSKLKCLSNGVPWTIKTFNTQNLS